MKPLSISKTEIGRFWKKVDKTGKCWTDKTGKYWMCWDWTAATNRDGYGRFSVNHELYTAHQISWMLANNQTTIPAGMYVRHDCDRPTCVNPEHLRLGTPKENAQERVLKGRANFRSGEDSPASKVNWRIVNEIRARYNPKTKHGYLNLSKEYGISRTAVRSIVKHLSWKKEPETTRT